MTFEVCSFERSSDRFLLIASLSQPSSNTGTFDEAVMMHKAVYGLVCYVAVSFKSDLKLDPSSHLGDQIHCITNSTSLHPLS